MAAYNFENECREYCKIRNRRLLVFWAGIPCGLLVAYLIRELLRGRLDWLAWLPFLVALLWFGSNWYFGMLLNHWPCPRCGKPFLRKAFQIRWPGQRIRCCVHCGLPRYAK